MLRYIKIRDFALIRDLEIEFREGLNLLTGETGSGKSIVVDALGLLLGERASPDGVRGGCDHSVVEGQFGVDGSPAIAALLSDAGITADDDQVLIRREVYSEGRSRAFINNTLSTQSLLKTLGEALVDIHGQHDHQALVRPGAHLGFIDRFGDQAEPVNALGRCYQSLRERAEALRSMTMDEQERLKRIDILQYQRDEIQRINPTPDEKENLENERRVLANSERIFSLAEELYALIYESEHSLLSRGQRAGKLLQEISTLDERWLGQREILAEILYKLEDLGYSARDYRSGIDFTPERLDQVEQRLSDIDRLTRKYGHSIAEMLDYAARCSRELEDLAAYPDRTEQLRAELNDAKKDYVKLATRISEKRRKDARQLEKEIKKELQSLSMEKTEFEARFAETAAPVGDELVPKLYGPLGIDRVEFMVSPNRGEELKPLARIASGGELSRIVLALKTICGGDEAGKTLVFDEVDAGIGGRVAEAVGRRLRDLSRRNQVLCVTHLPQIAAFAAQHYSVRKQVIGERTETFVELLNENDRVTELARMLGGETITETTLQHAREMRSHSQAQATHPE